MLHQEVSEPEIAAEPMSAASLRELVIQAGLEVLDHHGLGLRPDSISYAKVFAHLEEKYSIRVTRGSVHERIWDTHDDFRREVLAEALDSYPMFVRIRDVMVSSEAFIRFAGVHPDREQRALEFSRRAGRQLWEETVTSSIFSQIQSLKAIASRFNDPTASEVLHGALGARAQAQLKARRGFTMEIMKCLGRRANRDLGLSASEANGLIYLLNVTISVGGHLNLQVDCPNLGSVVKISSGPAGEYQSDTIGSVAMRSFVEHLTEVAPVHEVPDITDPADVNLPEFDPIPDGPEVSLSASIGQRRSREQLKRIVLAAGMELLLQDGLLLKPESLRYSVVLAHLRDRHGVGVSRASVHGRLWATHEEFCHEVLARDVGLGSAEQMGTDLDLSPQPAEICDANSGPSDPLSAKTMQDAYDVLREATHDWIETLVDSPRYRRRLLIKASLPERSDAPGMEQLRTAIQKSDRDTTDVIERFVRRQMLGRGMIVKPSLGLSTDEAVDLFGTLAQAIISGVVFHRLSGIETVSHRYRVRRVDGSGRFDDWTVASVAMRCYMDFLFCLDMPAE